MVYLFIFFIYLFWIISILGYGSLLNYFFNSARISEINDFKNIKLAVFGIFGLLTISVIGNLANFFVPLNLLFSIITFLIGVILFSINFKKIFSRYGKSEIIIIIVLFVFLSFIPFNWNNFNDTGIYHIQSIKWLNESVAPLGLANLYGRLGYNSSWFTIAAIVETPLLLKESPLFITNAIIMFFYGSAGFLTFFGKIKEKKFLFSDYFLIFTIIPWLRKTPFNMASLAPDLPVLMITLFVIYLLICFFEKRENNYLYAFILVIISLFAVTIKLSASPLLAGSVSAFIYYIISTGKNCIYSNSEKLNSKKSLYYKKLISTFFIILATWVARGIVLSGCIAYPSSIGYFKSLRWAVNPIILKNESDWIKSWARQASISPEKVLGNWDWLKPWLMGYIKGEKLLIFILIVGIIIIIIALIKKDFFRKDLNKNMFFVPLIVSFLGILFWFFTAPDPRFGYGFLFSFALLILSYGFYIVKLPKHEDIFKFISISIILLFFIIKPAAPLIINFKNTFINNWPEIPKIEVKEEKTNDGIKINIPSKGDQCWNIDLPATPYFKQDLKIYFNKDGEMRMFYY